MINYFPITFTHLDIIQEKLLNILFNYTTLEKSNFFYIPLKEILEIEELKNQIEHIGLLEYIHSSAINLYYTETPVIHRDVDKDTGDFKYSLNIPISGYANTYLSFYEPHAEPNIRYVCDVNFFEYDADSCTLIEKVETISPAIVNTQVPHAFDNFNDYPRIMLLLRLNRNVDDLIWPVLQESNPQLLFRRQK